MSLTSIKGIRVGHWQDEAAVTGCTVILCPDDGCIASATVAGHAPGTREIALLSPEKTVEKVHAVCLSGGSAFGLATADGVMKYLHEQGIGFATPFIRVPIVPAAVIYDYLAPDRDASVYPTAEAGYLAAQAASGQAVKSERIGAGYGATCGKYLQKPNSMDFGGIGSAELTIDGVTVAALSINNAFGDIIDPDSGKVVAGAHFPESPDGTRPEKSLDMLRYAYESAKGANTTLVVVATDAVISKSEAKRLADSCHAGMARAIRPSHTTVDGDTSFVLSTCEAKKLDPLLLTAAVQDVVSQAIVNGARACNP